MKGCILCGSKQFRKLFGSDNWQALKCQKCGLVKIEREKGISYKNYERDEDYRKFESQFRNIFRKRFNLIKRFVKLPAKVLEVGCSTGVLLAIFKEAGCEAWGVEPSESAEIARQKGIKVLRTTFEKADVPKDYFDVVILNHTLEHLENPVLVLQKVRTLLKKDGTVLIDVPNFDSLSSRLWGRNWPLLLPLEHNYQFTRETLEKIPKKVGLKPIHYESRSGLFEYANPIAEIFESLVTLKKRFFTNLLSSPLALIETVWGRGQSLSVVAKKN